MSPIKTLTLSPNLVVFNLSSIFRVDKQQGCWETATGMLGRGGR